MRILLAAAAGMLFALAAQAAEPVFPPGSRIGLVPPADMEISKRFSGFENAAKFASITFTEMPAEAYAHLATGMSDEALKRQGIVVSGRETLTLNGKEATLIAGEQTAGAMKLRKWVLTVSDPSMTAIVTAQSSATSGYSDEEIRKTLTGVALRPPLPMEEQIAALPFRLGDRSAFRPVRVINGSALLMTDGPSDIVKEAEQPVVIVASSLTPPPGAPEAREQFARQVLGATQSVKNWEIERSQAFRQGGQDWHEIVARAVDADSGKPIVVMQTIRFSPGRYVRMVGIVRSDARDAALPRFRRVIDSVEIE